MAERTNYPISVIPVFKNLSLSAGDSGTSGVIELNGKANCGIFGLANSVTSGTAGTVGTTIFSYVGSSLRDGTYVSPANAVAIGTAGTGQSSNIATFEPELMPFMKIIATQTGTGTAGYDSKVTAEFIVQ
jgi:hypothetical protein